MTSPVVIARSGTLLLSDVHLNVAEDGRAVRESFIHFLRQIDPTRTPQLILLGDLFDFWFEYRTVVFSGYFEILTAFALLREAGVEIHFVCGNHDFWAGRFLREHLGFHIHPDTMNMDFGGRRGFLIHGDGVNPDDRSYRMYKRIARNPFVIWAFRLLHPDWAMLLAQGVSRGSRKLFMARDLSQGPEVAPMRRYADGLLSSGVADIVFCGHSHYPVQEDTGHGVYINTGDWLYHRSYVTWDGESFSHSRFDG